MHGLGSSATWIKRLMTLVITLGLLLGADRAASAMERHAAGESIARSVTIKVNGTLLPERDIDSRDAGAPLVPIRDVAEALGMTVAWDANHQAVLIDTPAIDAHPLGQQVALIVRGNVMIGNYRLTVKNGTLYADATMLAAALGASLATDSVAGNEGRTLAFTRSF